MQLDDDRYHRELQALTLRLAEAAHDAGPAQPVPTCPAWTQAQLTAHVGFGHRWSWADDQTAGFWLRWITHDTLVHCLDAELAVGPRGRPGARSGRRQRLRPAGHVLDPAADRRLPGPAELRGSGQTLHFHATDPGLGAGGEWLARRTPSGVEWEHRHGPADAALRGRALDLLLVLSRRAAWTAPGSTPRATPSCWPTGWSTAGWSLPEPAPLRSGQEGAAAPSRCYGWATLTSPAP